jgi:GTP pyrophosphokinase
MDFATFKNKLLTYNNYSQEDLSLIEKTFYFGEKIYSKIKRKSGEPYINHCLRTAINLAELKLPKELIIAGILHDALEDGETTEEELKNNFGEEITFLVNGVTKIGHYRYKEKNLQKAENLRNLILAIAKDIRVAIIKLADRLDNMRTLSYLDEEKQKRIALETEDVFVPLALRLGISKWASELSDLALKHLEPEKYKWIVQEIDKKISNGKNYLEKIKNILEKEINDKNINLVNIEYRIKSPSSIYKKLKRKNFDLDQIYDLLAFRIIVTNIEECYTTLGIIHSLFKPLTHEFDDYIAFPKPNGYQSLHTTCIGPENKFIEFQIRTKEMHLINEEGIAAYFAYADSKQTKSYQKNRSVFADEDEIKIIKNLKNWHEGFNEIFSEKIYCLTPKGDIIELPSNSTPLDFAYKIHTYLGNHFSFAKVNKKIVPIDYELKNGDVVEIITSKQRNPSPHWLDIVKSMNAKKKIKSQLRKKHFIFAPKTIDEIKIIAQDRIGLLKDITDVISTQSINIVDSKTKTKKGIAHISFKIQINDKKESSKLKEIIKNKVKDIIKIE